MVIFPTTLTFTWFTRSQHFQSWISQKLTKEH